MVIRLRRKEIREYYETHGHLFAQIKCCADGSVFLIVKDETGKEVFQQQYCQRKSARIALGLRYGKCEYKGMTEVIGKERRIG